MANATLGERIDRLQREAQEADRALARAEGQLASAIERLQKEFGCRDEKEAQKELARLDQVLTKDEKQIAEELHKLEEAFATWKAKSRT